MYRSLASLSLVVFILFLAFQPEYKYPGKTFVLLPPCFLVYGILAWTLIQRTMTAKDRRAILDTSLGFSIVYALIILPMPFLGITEGENYSLVTNGFTNSHRITEGAFLLWPWEDVSQHPLHPEGSELLLRLQCPDNFKNIKLSGQVHVRWRNHSPRYSWTNGILSEEYFQSLLDDAVLTTLQILSQSTEDPKESFTRVLKEAFPQRVQDSFLEGEILEFENLELVVD